MTPPGAASGLRPRLWITMAFTRDGVPRPEAGTWADRTKARAFFRIDSLNMPGSWLSDTGYVARLVGRYAHEADLASHAPGSRR